MKKTLVTILGAMAAAWAGAEDFTVSASVSGIDFDWSAAASYDGEHATGPKSGDRIIIPDGVTAIVNANACKANGITRICPIEVQSGGTLNLWTSDDSALQRKCNTFVHSITGEGTINNTGVLQEIIILNDCAFSGKLTGSIHTTVYNGVTFRMNDPEQSHEGSPLLKDNSTFVARLFKGTNKNRVYGTGSFNLAKNTTIRYVGDESVTDDELDCSLWEAHTTILDAGELGGFAFSGQLGKSLVQWNLVLTGDNSRETVFKAYKNVATAKEVLYDAPVAISKRGTGTWRMQQNSNNKSTSVIEVRNGTLKFDNIEPLGTNCSLGPQNALYAFGTSTLADASKVDYALLLGDTDTEGMIQSVSADVGSFLSNQDRKIAIVGKGGIRSGTRSILFGGISASSAGEKTLILDGDQNHLDTVKDLSDGAGVLGIEKRGTGTWTVSSPANISGRISVKNGTLKLDNGGTAYNYYRLVFKQTAFHDERFKDAVAAMWPDGGPTAKQMARFTVSEFFMFDKDGKRVNVYPMSHYVKNEEMMPSGKIADQDYYIKSTAGIYNWQELQPGQFALEDPTGYASWIAGSTRQIAALFENGKTTATEEKYSANWHYNDWMDIYTSTAKYLDGVTEANFIKVILRLPAGSGTPTSCDFMHHYDSTSQYCGQDLTMFAVDGSVDGIVWDNLVDTQVTNLAVKASTSPTGSGVWAGMTTISAANLAKCYQFTNTAPRVRAAIALGSTVEVAAGATLVCDGAITISKLAVGTTMGTISGDATIAETGTVDLPRIPTGETSLTVTTSLKDVSGSANLANWTKTIDGGANCYDIDYDAQTGVFTLKRKPLLIIFK